MPPERRAVLLLLGLAVLGQWLRTRTLPPDAPPGEARLLAGGSPGSPRAHRDSSLVVSRPLGPGERIDLDRAGVADIARLPRVGLTLARTIVADRQAHGPFGGLEALDRVPGVGPGLLAAISDHAGFSAAGRLGDSIPGRDRWLEVGAPPSSTNRPGAESPSRRDPEPVDLNTATAAELERLPFVGPYMARQIVAFRERHGPFAAVDSLVRVPGIGPATVGRLQGLVRVE